MADRLKDHNITFLLIGNGPLEASLKESAKDNARVRFMDFQNQGRMPLVYRLGDVFILPSTGPGETWGLAINEASACSRPVMVSNKVGCAIDLVHQDKNGIIFSSDDIERCVEFLTRLVHDKDRIKHMGSYSRQIIYQYSFYHLIEGVKKIIQKL
ncbi:MAG: hypothetical protein DI539_29110 [Flavobacterium psychrophilum]|nr:MAG: hypothetical protein DI539_29110 [Flavobacterium psychrophilum]